MTTTKQRTFVEPTTATADDAGWRCTEQPQAAMRRKPSLSWRLRH